MRSVPRWRRTGLALMLALALPVAAAQDLAAAFRHAQQHDGRMAAAAAQRDAQAEKVVQGRAGMLPRVSLLAGNLHYASSFKGFSDAGVETSAVRSTNLVLSLTQPLYNPAAAAAYRGGQLQARLGEVQWAQSRAELATRLVQAWFDALAAQGQADLATQQRALVQARLAELATPPADGRDAEALDAERRELQLRLRRLATDDALARNQLLSRRLVLSSMAGPLPARLPELRDDWALDPRSMATLRDAVDQAAERSPAARVQQVQVALADNVIRQSRAMRAPTVDFVATYSNDRGFQLLPAGTIVGRSVGVLIQVPLFDGFSTVSRTRESQHLRNKARHEFEASHSLAAQEAMTTYLELEHAQLRAEACGEPSGLTGPAADSLDAKLEELFTQRECQRARIDMATAMLKLMVASGSFTETDLDAWVGTLSR